MKKVFIILAIAVISVACASSVEKKTEAYCKTLLSAFKKGDFGKAAEVTVEYMDYYIKLSVDDRLKADMAAEAYQAEIDKYEEALKDYRAKIERTAEDYLRKIHVARSRGNEDKADELEDALDEWKSTLSKYEQSIVDEVELAKELIEELF